MMNYGFCLANNPCDYRTVSIRAPPGSPLHFAREQQKQLFPNSVNDTEDPFYVFNIFYPLLAPGIPMEHSIFSPALFNAISVLAANERELQTLEISEHAIQIGNKYGNSRAALAAISQIIIELITHIVRLESLAPSPETQPQNLKQTHAQIYRDSQITLSESALVIAAWTLTRSRSHGLQGGWTETKHLLAQHMSRIPPGTFTETVQSRIQVRILERPSIIPQSGELFTLAEALNLLPRTSSPPSQPQRENETAIQTKAKNCLSTILKTSSRRIRALRGLDENASPFRFPLFACFVIALYTTNTNRPKQDTGVSEKNPSHNQEPRPLPPRLSRWASFLLDHYPPPPDDVAWTLEDEDDQGLVGEFDEVLEGLRSRQRGMFESLEPLTGGSGGDASSDAGAWWLSPNWLRWAWMMTEQECVQVPADPLAFLARGDGDEDGDGGNGNVMLETESYLYIPNMQG